MVIEVQVLIPTKSHFINSLIAISLTPSAIANENQRTLTIKRINGVEHIKTDANEQEHEGAGG